MGSRARNRSRLARPVRLAVPRLPAGREKPSQPFVRCALFSRPAFAAPFFSYTHRPGRSGPLAPAGSGAKSAIPKYSFSMGFAKKGLASSRPLPTRAAAPGGAAGPPTVHRGPGPNRPTLYPEPPTLDRALPPPPPNPNTHHPQPAYPIPRTAYPRPPNPPTLDLGPDHHHPQPAYPKTATSRPRPANPAPTNRPTNQPLLPWAYIWI